MTDLERAHDKIGQAYQVIGWLAHSPGAASDDELVRALDYFADEASYDPKFLPWPRPSEDTQ